MLRNRWIACGGIRTASRAPCMAPGVSARGAGTIPRRAAGRAGCPSSRAPPSDHTEAPALSGQRSRDPSGRAGASLARAAGPAGPVPSEAGCTHEWPEAAGVMHVDAGRSPRERARLQPLAPAAISVLAGKVPRPDRYVLAGAGRDATSSSGERPQAARPCIKYRLTKSESPPHGQSPRNSRNSCYSWNLGLATLPI